MQNHTGVATGVARVYAGVAVFKVYFINFIIDTIFVIKSKSISS